MGVVFYEEFLDLHWCFPDTNNDFFTILKEKYIKKVHLKKVVDFTADVYNEITAIFPR